MGESARETRSSLCEPSSPPPYTPLPLSGHVTLMLGNDSPTKRQGWVTTAADDGCREGTSSPAPASAEEEASYSQHQPQPDASGSVLESSFRRASVASGPQGDENGRDAAAIVAAELARSSAEHSATFPVDTVDHRSEAREMSPSPHLPHYISLSSSFPSARPPSPYPRSRSLSSQLPPLRQIRPSSTPPPELLAFRLPPLALQRQHSLETGSSSSTGTHQHPKRRRGKRVRSRSCQMETSGLTSVQEQTTVAIVQ